MFPPLFKTLFSSPGKSPVSCIQSGLAEIHAPGGGGTGSDIID